MRIFWIDDETGSGTMRRAKEGETLMDFVRETFKDEDLIRSMAHRWPDEEDPEDEWREFKPEEWFSELKPDDVEPYQQGWDDSRGDNPNGFRAPKILGVMRDARDPWDTGLTAMWVEAEVPCDTRYIYETRGAATDLDDYCGMGGGGYIKIEEER